jgi:rhodanese-related sulfurtransferase
MRVEGANGQDSVTVTELAAWRRDGTAHILLDVREPHELAVCAVEGAVHIPMGEVPGRLDELPMDVPLVVMCHHGMRSLQVVGFLRNAGWRNAINLDGGIDSWAGQVDAEMPRY